MSELFKFGKKILESQPFSALLGTELEVFEPARATVLSSGKTQAVCQCEVIAMGDTEERRVAFAEGTISKAG